LGGLGSCRPPKLAASPFVAAGLAIKARVARFACDYYWSKSEEDTDWDKLIARQLIDAVLTFADDPEVNTDPRRWTFA
jgi:hypothetical protein